MIKTMLAAVLAGSIQSLPAKQTKDAAHTTSYEYNTPLQYQ